MKVSDIKVMVLRIEGTNCEQEMHDAFRHLGADPELVHLKQLTSPDVDPIHRRKLSDYQALMLPGGFSSGDYVRAGAILAARIKSRLWEELTDFVREGYPVGGVCNGFQVLVELGFLPGFDGPALHPEAVLATNDSSRFECRPTLLKHEDGRRCAFTRLLEKGKVIMAPSAHAEGKLLFPQEGQEAALKRLFDNGQVVFRYVDEDGNYAGYPWNPNGSPENIAGICNPEGNVFGMMPHPERVFFRHTHNDWQRCGLDGAGDRGDGRVMFESVLDYLGKKF
jgi:phosphoribosylformylglycinamidine synthase